MAKFRFAIGGYTESMLDVKIVQSYSDMIELIKNRFGTVSSLNLDDIKIRYYGFDGRNKWDTYIVYSDSFGTIAFMDTELHK